MVSLSLMKLLLVRFSSMGDIILTSPVVRCLKSQLPGLELHVLTKEGFRTLYELNPYVDKVFTIRENLGEVLPGLKAERYDRIIDLHRNLRTFLLWLKLGRKRSVFPKLNFRKWMLVRLHLNLMPRVHIVDRYFRAVRSLGVVNDHRGLDFFISPEDEMDINDLPSEYHEGYYAVVTGGRHSTKILPANKVAEVILALGRPVVLLGGPEDRERAEEVIKLTGESAFNGCGKYNLGQSASLLRQSLAVITNDTGLMHIAAALHKRIVSVWGSTVPELGMYPYLPGGEGHSSFAEVKGLYCRPCSKIGYKRCPRGHFHCMEGQDTQHIAKMAMGKD